MTKAGSTIAVRVTRQFPFSPENVFDAWLDPELTEKWFAAEMGEIVRVHIDPIVRGSFAIAHRRSGMDIEHVGEYLEIDRPRRLSFTWAVADEDKQSRVFIDITPLPPGCELTLVHQLHPDCADYSERTEQAWNKMLDAMALAIGACTGKSGATPVR